LASQHGRVLREPRIISFFDLRKNCVICGL
jgi:hypothetical protein